MDDEQLEALAREALHHWDGVGGELELVSRSENVVFRVRGAERDHALRIHRPGYHTRQELDSEQVWARALHTAGVGVPLGVPTRDGKHYAEVGMPGADETRQVGLVPWFDGVTLATKLRSAGADLDLESAYARIGSIMARMHLQASQWTPPAGFVRHALDADGLMGEAPFWGPFWDLPQLAPEQTARLLRARDELHRRLEALGKDPAIYSLIHADLHAGNVMFDGDTLRVIDFDDAGFGFHAYDLAVCLFDVPPDRRPSAREALVRGYRGQRALDDGVLSLLPTFDLIRGLALIGWLHARPEQPRKYLQAVLARTFQRLDEGTAP